MSLDLLECPEDCDSLLSPVDFNPCAPDLRDAEIVYWLIAKGDQPLSNVQDPAELSTRISDDSTADTAIRRLLGIGAITAEFGAERKIPGGKINYAKNTYTGTLDIYDLNDTNYEFMRSTSCNTQYRIWPVDSNGYIFGGNTGILAVVKGKNDITNNRDELQVINLQFKYSATRPPVRDAYVLAADDDNLL